MPYLKKTSLLLCVLLGSMFAFQVSAQSEEEYRVPNLKESIESKVGCGYIGLMRRGEDRQYARQLLESLGMEPILSDSVSTLVWTPESFVFFLSIPLSLEMVTPFCIPKEKVSCYVTGSSTFLDGRKLWTCGYEKNDQGITIVAMEAQPGTDIVISVTR
ncbi:MAG: hypothetical protein U9R01_01900 [candidate division WOR-3 bacterium]|nr:hypothetical protein [candidate division WOR-3 bacterium]